MQQHDELGLLSNQAVSVCFFHVPRPFRNIQNQKSQGFKFREQCCRINEKLLEIYRSSKSPNHPSPKWARRNVVTARATWGIALSCKNTARIESLNILDLARMGWPAAEDSRSNGKPFGTLKSFLPKRIEPRIKSV